MQEVQSLVKQFVADLTQQLLTSVGGKQPHSTVEPDVNAKVQDKSVVINVNKVFTTLRISYPAWYQKHYDTEHFEKLAKRIWVLGIKHLTSAQVDNGLRRIVLEQKFPLNLHDFLKLCRLIEGLPSLENAWLEALKGNYSHLIISLTAHLTGRYELIRASYDNRTLKELFEFYYEHISQQFLAGFALEDGQQVVPTKRHDVLDRIEQEQQQKISQRIKAQGIDKHNARAQCLDILGFKDKILSDTTGYTKR